LRSGEATRGVAIYAPPGAPANPWLGPVSLAAPGDRIPATAGSLSGRAMAERRPVAVDDLPAVVEAEYPDLHAAFVRAGTRPPFRSMVVSPLLSRGEPVGVLTVARHEVRPFTPDEVRLLELFADQAVIAIENSRLFSELQDRLEEQTATAEVLRAISESPTD